MTEPIIAQRLLRGILAVALLGPGAPALAADSALNAASAPGSAGSLERITALIGEAECDNLGQCHAVGIGAKPCGGPSGYLPWSSKRTDASALAAAVEAQAAAQKQENRVQGLASDCSVLPEPAPACRPRAADGKKTCQLGQGGVRSSI